MVIRLDRQSHKLPREKRTATVHLTVIFITIILTMQNVLIRPNKSSYWSGSIKENEDIKNRKELRPLGSEVRAAGPSFVQLAARLN